MNYTEFRKIFPTGCKVVQALIPIRPWQQILSLVIATLLVGSNAQAQGRAQTGDWRAVENLEPGIQVIVKAQRRYACTFEGATERELTCWVHHRWFRTVSIAIPRSAIREVRTLPNQAKDTWIGAGIGAGAGAIAAGTTSRDYPGVNAFFGGLAGAGAGALVGSTIPIFQYLIKHGKCIYKG
jgi:hypothetical protein